MKKILNDPYEYVDEMLAGLTAARPRYYALAGEDRRVVARVDGPVGGKVGIVVPNRTTIPMGSAT